MRQFHQGEDFPLMETMEVACAVFREQGFIKSNEGFWDPEKEVRIDDNRSVCLATLRKMHGTDVPEDIRTVEVTDVDRNHAQVVFKYFDQRLMMGKIGDNLSPYDKDLITPFEIKTVNSRRDLGRIASLPNSYEISKQRDRMKAIFNENKTKGSFVGAVKDRLKVEAQVLDVKFLPKQDSYIITGMTDEDQIVKFFLGKEPSDPAAALDGKRISFVGTVRSHEESDYSECKETVFNRVKIV